MLLPLVLDVDGGGKYPCHFEVRYGLYRGGDGSGLSFAASSDKAAAFTRVYI